MKQAIKNVSYNLSVLVSNNRYTVVILLACVTIWGGLGMLAKAVL